MSSNIFGLVRSACWPNMRDGPSATPRVANCAKYPGEREGRAEKRGVLMMMPFTLEHVCRQQ
eukprot:864202-Rhodomonas_salina.2